MLSWAFLGVPLATLLPLAAGVGGVTVLLYLLKLRRRPLVVPFIQLWQQELGENSASALRSRLRRLLSLLLQLILLAALLLALAEPQPDAAAEPEASIVVLVDTSASMSAPSQDPKATRLARAQTLITRRLAERGPRDEVLLVEMSGQPTPLGPWTRSEADLQAALSTLSPKDQRANLEAALRIARDALQSRTKGRVVIVSDGALPPVSLSQHLGQNLISRTELEFLPTHGATPGAVAAASKGGSTAQDGGTTDSQDNVAISALAGRRYRLDPARFEVLLEVANTGRTPAEVDVLCHRPDENLQPAKLIEVRRLRVGPNDRSAQLLTELSAIEHGILCRVERVDGGENWLARDDTARALLSPRPPLDVLVVGESNNFLSAALLTDPSLVVKRIAASAYPPPEPYDLVIFDHVFPPRRTSTGAALYLGAPIDAAPPGYPLTLGKELSLFGFDSWAKRSPLFRFVDPYDVQVLAGRELTPRAEDEVLGRSGQSAILVTGLRPEGRFVALGFDPKESDFVLRAAFPLFVSNLIDFLSPDRLGEESQGLRLGTNIRLKTEGKAGAAKFEGPLGTADNRALELPTRAGEANVEPQLAGFYRLTDDRGPRLLAANYFDPQEASWMPQTKLARLDGPPLAGRQVPSKNEQTLGPVAALQGLDLRSPIEPWMALLLVVSAASLIEWWTYHRRLTV